MKSLFLSIFVLLIFSTVSQAQFNFGLGVQVGLNLASQSTNPTDPSYSSGRTGMTFGAFGDFGFIKYLAVETGLNFTLKGATYNISNGVQTEPVTLKISQLEIPIIVKGKYPVDIVDPYVFFGGLIGIQISATADESSFQGGSSSVDESSNFGGVDFGLIFGAGCGVKVVKQFEPFIQFGYAIGLSNINKVANSTETIKNNGFRISAGGIFHF